MSPDLIAVIRSASLTSACPDSGSLTLARLRSAPFARPLPTVPCRLLEATKNLSAIRVMADLHPRHPCVGTTRHNRGWRGRTDKAAQAPPGGPGPARA